jgi:hypothetical protein
MFIIINIDHKKSPSIMNRPICIKCKSNVCKKNGFFKNGNPKYKKYCNPCEHKIYNINIITYRSYKKQECEKCGFVPIHRCQLDVDHIDNNHSNDDISNLQTLCANCHRLKSHVHRMSKNKKKPLK